MSYDISLPSLPRGSWMILRRAREQERRTPSGRRASFVADMSEKARKKSLLSSLADTFRSSSQIEGPEPRATDETGDENGASSGQTQLAMKTH
jgi:hypothetical protein